MDEAGARRTERTERIVRLTEITPGTRVIDEAEGATGREGTVLEVVPDTGGAVGGVRVAWSDGSRILVPLRTLSWRENVLAVGGVGTITGETARETTTATTRKMTQGEETLTVPIITEQLVTDTVWREAGVVRLRVHSEAAPQTTTHEIERDELYVEEVTVGRELAPGEQLGPRQEGEVLIIPVIEEEIVVTTRRVLTREVRITRRATRQSRTVDATTRRTVVEIDVANLGERVHLTESATPDVTRHAEVQTGYGQDEG